MKTRFLLCGLLLASGLPGQSAQLTQSTFTEVIRDVNVVAQAGAATAAAKTNDLFKYPDLVRTGPDSRAELTAADQTITRVGANTAFSFRSAGRDVNLEQGSLLFHSPSGKGGGTIKSGGASAAVLGTTIIVATTPVTAPTDKNGFKVVVLESKCRVTLPNGRFRILHAGQMVYILAGQTDFGPVLDINLDKLIAGSNLIIGFSHELPSMPLIKQAVEKQDYDLRHGRAVDTGIPADKFRGQPGNIPGNGFVGTDVNNFQIGALSSFARRILGSGQFGNVPPGFFFNKGPGG